MIKKKNLYEKKKEVMKTEISFCFTAMYMEIHADGNAWSPDYLFHQHKGFHLLLKHPCIAWIPHRPFF